MTGAVIGNSLIRRECTQIIHETICSRIKQPEPRQNSSTNLLIRSGRIRAYNYSRKSGSVPETAETTSDIEPVVWQDEIQSSYWRGLFKNGLIDFRKAAKSSSVANMVEKGWARSSLRGKTEDVASSDSARRLQPRIKRSKSFLVSGFVLLSRSSL